MLERLLVVKVWRGEGGGLSDHFLVEARLKLLGGWRSAGRMEGVRNVLKVSELNHSVKKGHTRRACVENMKCGEVGRSRVWVKFRDMVIECTNDVCGRRCIGGQ